MARVLVTNDDGIDAPGLASLAAALDTAGFEVVVVAPMHEMSGAACAMGPLKSPDRLDFEPRRIPGLDVEAYAIDGPPAMCVIGSLLGGFGEPADVVASGVNPGNNTGRSILHSGTVGAALTAVAWGRSGVAVSIGTGSVIEWSSAAVLATRAVEWLGTEVGRGSALNLNVPNLALDSIGGVAWAEPAPHGSVRTEIVALNATHIDLAMVDASATAPPDSDTAVVASGRAAITLLDGPRPTSRGRHEHLVSAATGWLC